LVRSRLLSPREAARLMGLSDDYKLPKNYNDAYGLMGDGVVVPAVRFLAQHILEPILAAGRQPHADDIDTETEVFDLWFELHEDAAREWNTEAAQ
jgi:hypothetical protein